MRLRVSALLVCLAAAGCKGGLLGGGGGGGGKNLTQPVMGLTATAGNAEITLNWSAYAAATNYAVRRSTTSGGPYNYINNSPLEPPITATTYTDPGLTNGNTYYYQVVANGSWGVSNPSNQASATPSGPSKNIAVTVDVLANRHAISQYLYGGAFPERLPTTVNAMSTTLTRDLSSVRWGGNASSTYNWQLQASNAATDSFFEDLTFCGVGGPGTSAPCTDSDSVQFIKDTGAVQEFPVMTIPMLPWVAQSPAGSGNGHWSFSVARDGAQCHVDSQNPDAGDGIAPTSNCDTQPTYLTASATDISDTYAPLLDDHSQTCPAGASCVYRSDWVAALAGAFSGSSLPLPHFYEMDNEMDMWGTTHHDIHPNPSGYDELANVYLTEATKLKGWDPKAVRLGPVSCCWLSYWNGAKSGDKAAHAGDDFLPWWLNQIYWHDQISGSRSLDVLDIHAFPDATTTDSGGNPLSQSQLQALATSIYRDYWDPTFVSPSSTINQPNATNIQPDKTVPFRIPRIKALVNAIYPGTPVAITEWSAAFAGESDFSTALADADAYGIMSRENVYIGERWKAPKLENPNYWALRMYTNYDGFESAWGTSSISAVHSGDPNLFSAYGALGGFLGNVPSVMIINKDPQNSAQVQFTFKNFDPTAFTSYTLTAPYPIGISSSVATANTQPWSPVQNVPPYSITLFVLTGSFTTQAASWILSPDTLGVPGGGIATVHATGGGTLASAVFDAYEGAPACAGNIALTNPTITNAPPGVLTVSAGNTPGFCHFTVTANDGGSQGGWIVVGNPAASLTIASGNNQTGTHATTLPIALAVSLAPGSSGGANPAVGASILFSTNAGSLSNGVGSGPKVMAITDASGVASVTLTLPSAAQTVTVTAEGPYGLGHPMVTFSETSQ